MAVNRSNLLIVIADQLAARMLPAYGNTVAKTPNIDQLASEGVVFENNYCNSPLCGPARFSIMTGQLPSAGGVYDNAAEFPSEVPTFGHYLRSAGYRTILSGKMHFCGPDQLHGFEERLTTDIYPADFGWTPDWTRIKHRPTWYHSPDSIVSAGPCVRSNQIDYDEEVIFATRRTLFDIARSADQRPFCLVTSLTHPHDPFTIGSEYWSRYSDAEINLPHIREAPTPIDPHSQRLLDVCALTPEAVTEEQLMASRHAYCGAISYVDDQIGILRKTLQEAGLADNTIIVLMSDHGEMLGERGMWYKMSFFEAAARVPLIIHAPRKFAPHRVNAAVSHIDFLPTLVDLAHGKAVGELPTDIAGQSLLPHLLGEDGPNGVWGEYLAEGAIAPIIMRRHDRWKFIHSPADPDQLYDLLTDPDEINNLASTPETAALRAQFHAEIAARWDLVKLHQDVLSSQRRRRFVSHALTIGKLAAWDYQPPRDASREYIRAHLDLEDIEARARFPHVRPVNNSVG
jgi:choline-sulfatase